MTGKFFIFFLFFSSLSPLTACKAVQESKPAEKSIRSGSPSDQMLTVTKPSKLQDGQASYSGLISKPNNPRSRSKEVPNVGPDTKPTKKRKPKPQFDKATRLAANFGGHPPDQRSY